MIVKIIKGVLKGATIIGTGFIANEVGKKILLNSTTSKMVKVCVSITTGLAASLVADKILEYTDNEIDTFAENIKKIEEAE